MQRRKSTSQSQNLTPDPSERLLNEQDMKDLGLFYSYDISRCKTAIQAEAQKRQRHFIRRAGNYAAVLLIGLVLTGLGIYLPRLLNPTLDLSNVSAGSPKAILELANGSSLLLEGSNPQVINDINNIKINKYSDFISYNMQDIKREAQHLLSDGLGIMHKITTPRGGEYRVILADGTLVHLNADSRLIFPAKFVGKTREVYLTGEAYFSVTKSDIPFIVHSDGLKINVLGTKFNVSAYSNDPTDWVTLEEGSVRVEAAGCNFILVPGEQLLMDRTSRIAVKATVDAKEFSSWKEGLFVFNDEPITNIARKLSRWYNVDFDTTPNLNIRFTGRIKRYESVEKLMNILELTNELKFKVTKENIKITEPVY